MQPNTPPRIRLSDRAQSKIRGLMGEEGRGPSAVRVYAELGATGSVDLALSFDREREYDVAVPADGVTIVADPETLAIARDRLIDYGVEGFTFAPDSGCESRPLTE